jgi:hypothetical protein
MEDGRASCCIELRGREHLSLVLHCGLVGWIVTFLEFLFILYGTGEKESQSAFTASNQVLSNHVCTHHAFQLY